MTSIYIPSILLAIPRNPVTALGLPLAFGILSGIKTGDTVKSSWYKNLFFPPGNPPKQVFPIVWPILYLSMGYASHIAVKALDSATSPSTQADLQLGLALYYGQLVLNTVWSPIFFGARELGWGLVDITALLGTTLYMTKLLDGATDSKTTLFLVPYCAWLTFATYLNGGIWWLNLGRRNI
jgi:benzodiazapine receptor